MLADVGPFFDQHLTLGLIRADEADGTRHLEELGFQSVIVGRLERTGIASVQAHRPCKLTVDDTEALLARDPQFRAFIREALVEDANAHLKAKVR